MTMRQGKHRSMRGRYIDMDAMRNKNQHAPALGNASMNARGDVIGSHNNVIVRREQIIQSYYKNNPAGVKRASIKDISAKTFETPKEAVDRLIAKAATPQVDHPKNVVGKPKGRTLVDKKND
jgi:hypothetical protein